MNMVHLFGNIGAEPDFRRYESGKRKVSFSLALNYYKQDGNQCETIWIPCVAWDAVCDRLLRCRGKSKLSGRKINVTGSFAQSIWVDQVSGKRQNKLLVNILLFEVISIGRPEQPHQQQPDCEGKEVFTRQKTRSRP